MSNDKVCLKRFEFTYMSIVSLCCYMDIQVSPVPIQPKTLGFDFKKTEQRNV